MAEVCVRAAAAAAASRGGRAAALFKVSLAEFEDPAPRIPRLSLIPRHGSAPLPPPRRHRCFLRPSPVAASCLRKPRYCAA